MSALYYKHQLQTLYVEYKQSLVTLQALLNKLDEELITITDKNERFLFMKRMDIISQNYDKQIDLINGLYTYINEHMIEKESYDYQKEKLNIARQFIKSLGGDPNSINWLKKTDFRSY